jgi:hypothetical protein
MADPEASMVASAAASKTDCLEFPGNFMTDSLIRLMMLWPAWIDPCRHA